MENEFEDGHTIMVLGFHRHLREWWGKVEGRGNAIEGLVQSVEDT